jgi:putative ABC transport system permease protein
MTFSGGSTSVTVEGAAQDGDDEPVFPVFRIVSPGYLETMGVAVRGRGLTGADRAGSEPVVVVNEALAHRYWPGGDALGKRLKLGGPTSSEPWMTVIGVAHDVRQFAMESAARPELYVSYLQSGDRGFFLPRDLVLRTAGDPRTQVPTLRAIVRGIDAGMPLSDIRTVRDIVAGSVAQRRYHMLLVLAFASAALALAAVGMYGIVAHAVERRTREIGVRVALGARGADILRAVLRQSALMIVAGTALGVAGGVAVGRVMRDLLFGIDPLDVATFVLVVGTLLLVALVAVLVPVRRALRVDPAEALQAE